MSNKKLLSYWKKILKLNDWKIKLVENCCQQDMSSSVDVSGEVDYDDVHSCAVIRMLDKKYSLNGKIIVFENVFENNITFLQQKLTELKGE